MSQKLLVYYCRQVLVYALLTSLLFVSSASLLSRLLGEPVGPVWHGVWMWLNLLAGLGPFMGIALERYVQPQSRYLYANFGLTAGLLYPPAFLLVWLTAALVSVSLQIYDGRIRLQEQFANGQSWWMYGHKLFSDWLSHHPEAFWALVLMALFALCLGLIGLLSGAERQALTDDEQATRAELSIDSVQHSFGSRQVLKGAWLKLSQGEVLGLLGRNGCGKSTLLQIIFGLVKADFRALFLNGHPVKNLCRLGVVAYLPQQSILPPYMRVRRAIRLFAGEASEGLLAQEPRIQELLSKRVFQLSGGERRLLELGLVLSLERPFVLLDEPFSELEPLYKARVRNWIVQAARQGAGVVVTDHDYHQILKISNRLLLMTQGQTELISDESELKRLYLPVS